MTDAHAHSGTGRLRLLLGISLCLNLGLAVAALRLTVSRDAVQAPAEAPAAIASGGIKPMPVIELEQPVVYSTNRFHWRLLESPNVADYAVNLRAIGCPEKTVRDILLPELDELYQRRRRLASAGQSFWISGRQRQAADRAQDEVVATLSREFEPFVRELLGITWYPGWKEPFGNENLMGQAVARFLLGPMSDDQLRQTLMVIEKYEDLESAMRRRFGGIMTEEDASEFRTLSLRMMQDLQAELTPLQWEEMSARLGAIGMFDDVAFHAVDWSPAELRQVAFAWWNSSGSFEGLSGPHDWRTDEERLAGEAQFTNSVKAVLGSNRFADFVRAQDKQFGHIFEFTSERKLPKEAAIGVYEIRRLAVEEAQRLRADPTLDDAARRQQFTERQLQIQAAMEGVLGAEMCVEYLSHGGAWITNMAGL